MTNRYHQPYQAQQHLKAIIEAYASFVETEMESSSVYPSIITFMFHHICGTQAERMDEMRKEIERVYAVHVTRHFRNPRSPKYAGRLPRWIVFFDFPVQKHEKTGRWDVTINDGLHAHAFALTPTESRLRVAIDSHFFEKRCLYIKEGKPLRRIHARVIDHDPAYVTDYLMKSIPRRRVDLDDIIILPRARSEVMARSFRTLGKCV